MNITIPQIAETLKSIPDPRSKQGISHPFSGLLALVLLGLTARHPYITHITEWASHHWNTLKTPLGFKSPKPPDATTISRALAKLSLADFQEAMSAFFNLLLSHQSNLTAAVDGKTSKQFRQADGEPIHMLNVFVHDLNVTLAQYSVKDEKTNEEACLKKHAAELFEKYPFIQLLTGDAIFAARPLLTVLKELDKDYLFCVKNNQPDILESAKQAFARITPDNCGFQKSEKKRAA